MRLSLLDNRRKILLYLDEDKVIPKYTVTWKNWDGTDLYVDAKTAEGGIPAYAGPTPTRPATQTVRYEFAGWTPSVVAVTGDTTYTATFTEVPIMVQVQWLNYDSSVIKMEEVQAGTKPTYSGTDPMKPSTAQYRYNFTGWSPSPAIIYEDTVYTAQFQEVSIESYTVQFIERTMRNYTSSPQTDVTVEKFSGSWSDLIDSINDGTYRTKYKVGQYNSVDFGSEGTINMQIIGINRDYDEDGNFIPITLLSMKQLSGGGIPFGSNNNAVSWTNSTVRSRLYSRILNNIPEPLKSHLIPAVKYTVDSGNLNNRTVEELFVPSRHELFENIDSTGTYDSETMGPVYNISLNRGGWYWTRSKAYPNDNRIQYCQSSNKIDVGYNTYQYDVYFGFCIGNNGS